MLSCFLLVCFVFVFYLFVSLFVFCFENNFQRLPFFLLSLPFYLWEGRRAYNGALSKPHSECLFQLICFYWFKVSLANQPGQAHLNSLVRQRLWSQKPGPSKGSAAISPAQAKALEPWAWVKQRLWSHLPGAKQRLKEPRPGPHTGWRAERLGPSSGLLSPTCD